MTTKFTHKTLSQERQGYLLLNIAKDALEAKQQLKQESLMNAKQLKKYGELRDKATQRVSRMSRSENEKLNELSKLYVEYLKAGNEPVFDVNANTEKQMSRPKSKRWKHNQIPRKRLIKGSESGAEQSDLGVGPE